MQNQDVMAAIAANTVTAAPPRAEVSALCVFAAGRRSFEVIVRWDAPMRRRDARRKSLDAIFAALPLAENGWKYSETVLSLVAHLDGADAIWRVSRAGAAASDDFHDDNSEEGLR